MYRTKTITFGDKIFARVTCNGRTVYNFVSERVANMADLISQLRRAMRDMQGLVMLHIRNYHQGWGEERPLMLYAQRLPATAFHRDYDQKPTAPESEPRMFFPWETH